MKEIILGNLYPSLLNTKESYGNIKLISYYLNRLNIDNKILDIEVDDQINMEYIDALFILEGGKKSTRYALDYLKKYKEKFYEEFIQKEKLLFSQGTGFELLGENFELRTMKIRGLGLLKGNFKFQKKVSLKEKLLMYKDWGFREEIEVSKTFKNANLSTYDPLFSIVKNEEIIGYEGIRLKNIFATQITGPFLFHNKALLQDLLEVILLKSIDKIKIPIEDIRGKIESLNYDLIEEGQALSLRK